MTKSQEQLEFAVRFAQEKLSELRPGDLLNFRDDFNFFFSARQGEDIRGPIGETVMPLDAAQPKDYAIADFKVLQKEVFSILDNLVKGRDAVPLSSTPCKITVALTAFSLRGVQNRAILMAQGSTRDMFLLRLYLLLSQEPIDRILRCKAADCDRLFYRKRKQEFCSQRCTNRQYQKKYRDEARLNPILKKAVAKESHRRYERRKGKKAKRRTLH